MVERTEPTRNWRSGWRATILVVVLISLAAPGFWLLVGVETPEGLYPTLTNARKAFTALFGVAALACILIAAWDRLRQTGPESEREISLKAFSDVSVGLTRPLIFNLAFSFFMLQSGLFLLPDFLTLVAQHAWLKVGAAAPLMLLAAHAPFSQYPALIREWRGAQAVA